MTPAGEFRHSVTVKKPNTSRAKDAGGREVATFDDVVTCTAKVAPLSGRTAFIVAQRHGEATHEVTLRYMPALATMDASWVLDLGGRVLVQDAPPRNVDERNRELVLTCLEGVRTQ